MSKILERVLNNVCQKATEKQIPFRFKVINFKSCLVINESKRKMVLMTINALDNKGKQILAFGVTLRKCNWESQLKNYSEMELLGRLSNGAFKALPLGEIVDFIS